MYIFDAFIIALVIAIAMVIVIAATTACDYHVAAITLMLLLNQ